MSESPQTVNAGATPVEQGAPESAQRLSSSSLEADAYVRSAQLKIGQLEAECAALRFTLGASSVPSLLVRLETLTRYGFNGCDIAPCVDGEYIRRDTALSALLRITEEITDDE